MSRCRWLALPVLLVLPAGGAFAAESGVAESGFQLDGSLLGLAWVIPFAGLLLSIAILPLVAHGLWHRHYGKIAAAWALALLVPFAATFGFEAALFEVVHTLVLEYLPFIVLLYALYTVSGGVRLTGRIRPSPATNTGLLAGGTLLANVMGTTGAAMLLIRPLLHSNAGRKHGIHVVVFFIFLVANIGGSLTPLGDPPLFLGFLKGVAFFWTTRHMAAPFLLTAGLVLAVFYFIDRYYFARDGHVPHPPTPDFGLEGIHNIVLLGAIAAAVLMSGFWRPGTGFTVYHVEIALQNLVRDVLLLIIAGISLVWTPAKARAANYFSWFPIVEVAKLFAAIFVTIVPAIAILRAGEGGALGFLVRALSENGQPVNALYFWATGLLSSFLDNAPTYLVFFNTASGDPDHLMGGLTQTLLAISAGAVFMGAMTYIGNAPNFMVRSIAEEHGLKMPSFFGYMAWSVTILIPVFAIVTLVFFP
jgi:Na+/H+ antiporter NhaD/arsenite permease-like protein